MSKQPDNFVPTLEDNRLMWETVDFPPCSEAYPRVAEFVSALGKIYVNGRVLHRAFQFPNHSVFDFHATRNRYYEIGFFERFWLNRSVQAAILHQLEQLDF